MRGAYAKQYIRGAKHKGAVKNWKFENISAVIAYAHDFTEEG